MLSLNSIVLVAQQKSKINFYAFTAQFYTIGGRMAKKSGILDGYAENGNNHGIGITIDHVFKKVGLVFEFSDLTFHSKNREQAYLDFSSTFRSDPLLIDKTTGNSTAYSNPFSRKWLFLTAKVGVFREWKKGKSTLFTALKIGGLLSDYTHDGSSEQLERINHDTRTLEYFTVENTGFYVSANHGRIDKLFTKYAYVSVGNGWISDIDVRYNYELLTRLNLFIGGGFSGGASNYSLTERTDDFWFEENNASRVTKKSLTFINANVRVGIKYGL